MKILQLDVNKIEFEPVKEEAKVFEKADRKKVTVNDALVLFVSIEANDDDSVARRSIADAVEFARKQKINRLVIYPFAHLSEKLAKPKQALEVLEQMRELARKAGNLDMVSAPFGWTKKLEIDVKGHPLAEMSRSYAPGEKKEAEKAEADKASNALREEEKVKSTWYILDVNGELIPVEKFNFAKHPKLKKLADYEIKKVRSYQQVPPHIPLMRKLQLVDYEPGSDPGNLRYYPNGRTIKTAVERYVTQKVVDYGAVEVETPIMYDYEHPALEKYLERFPARHYIVKSEDKDYFLRFAACFGQFLIAHDSVISYKHLPFKIFEMAKYSFRREKSGELAGLKRLRAFIMPDMHTLCADLKQAEQEFYNQFKFCKTVLADIGIGNDDYEAAIRFTEAFWKDNKDFIIRLVKEEHKRPVLIETWSFRYAYFDPKFEFNVIDSMDKATALSTVQIDHENGDRYDINYVDSEGNKKKPVILHCSPSGAIERVIYAFLELSAIRQKEGKTPSLPLWLSPTQVRFLPISDRFIEKCTPMADKLKAKGIRVDVDDTSETLGKKIRNAELEWVPYIIVVGEKELESGKLAVRIREPKNEESMSMKELEEMLEKRLGSMPRVPLTQNMLLSKRPIYVG